MNSLTLMDCNAFACPVLLEVPLVDVLDDDVGVVGAVDMMPRFPGLDLKNGFFVFRKSVSAEGDDLGSLHDDVQSSSRH